MTKTRASYMSTVAERRNPMHRLAHLEHLALPDAFRSPGHLRTAAAAPSFSRPTPSPTPGAIVDPDPYVVSGIFNEVELHPFLQVFPQTS